MPPNIVLSLMLDFTLRRTLHFTRRTEGQDEIYGMPTRTSLKSKRSLLPIDVQVDMVQKTSVPSNSRSTASGLIIPYFALCRSMHFTRRTEGQDEIYGMPTRTSLKSQRSLLSIDVSDPDADEAVNVHSVTEL